MSHTLEKICREVIPQLDQLTHPLLGRTTLSVGTIRGGSKTNIVPDSCEATIDIRLVPDTEPLSVVELLRQVSVGLELSYQSSPPLFSNLSHALIQQLSSLGATPVGAPWFCDAAVFSAKGMPSVALGPGSITQAHTEDEWIKITDLEAGADFFERFLRSLR
jgi:acetylornithine deacetylase/succinyl-diaminopimelate desuccinylase-like protein